MSSNVRRLSIVDSDSELAKIAQEGRARLGDRLVGLSINESTVLSRLEQARNAILDGHQFATVIQALRVQIATMLPQDSELLHEIMLESTNILVVAALQVGSAFSDKVLDEPAAESPVQLVGIGNVVESMDSRAVAVSLATTPLLDALFETSTVGVCLADSDGNLIRVNQRLLEITGLPASRLVGFRATSLVRSYGTMSEPQLHLVSRFMLGESHNLALESVFMRPDGSRVSIAADSTRILDEQGHIEYFLSFVEDITDRNAIQRARRNSEERIQALIQNSSDIIGIISDDGYLEFVSDSIQRILGYTPVSLLGQLVLDLVVPEEQVRVEDLFDRVLDTPRHTAQIAARLLHANGSWRWMELDFINLTDVASVGGIVVTARDVTTRKSAEQQMERLAYYDPLTALPNRMHFRDRLDAALRHAESAGQAVAVVFIDLDRFKLINDRYGHDGGDSALVAVGQRILDSLRPGEMVARLGGDEFALLIENATRARAMQTATRIVNVLCQRFPDHYRFFTIDASAGVAISSSHLNQANELLRAADIALYQGKATGGGVVTLFDPAMYTEAIAHAELERELQVALDQHEMVPWFQPEFDLATGQITGLEVLMRWQRSAGEILEPEAFLDVAIDMTVIIPLGLHILREACAHVVEWQRLGAYPRHLPIGFNISYSELCSPGYADAIAGILQDTGLDPASLEIEIEDRVFRDASPELDRFVEAIQKHGIALVVDGFGGGYASWNQLRRLPVRRVKIAREAAGKTDVLESDLTILHAITTMSATLDVLVTAVGLATEALVERARATRCQRGQGIWLSPPLPASEVLILLRDHTFASRP